MVAAGARDAESMAVSGIAASYIQSYSTPSSWLLDASSNAADDANWFGGASSSSSDTVIAAANAFAQVAQILVQNQSSLAVNKGIQTLQSQLASDPLGLGQQVNILA